MQAYSSNKKDEMLFRARRFRVYAQEERERGYSGMAEVLEQYAKEIESAAHLFPDFEEKPIELLP